MTRFSAPTGIQLGQRAEGAAGQDVVTHDRDLPLHPALPGRTVSGEHVDGEPVVLGERRRLRMQRHRPAGDDMVVLGPAVAFSARWLTEFYPRQPGTGELAFVFRLAFGSGMAASIVIAPPRSAAATQLRATTSP